MMLPLKCKDCLDYLQKEFLKTYLWHELLRLDRVLLIIQ